MTSLFPSDEKKRLVYIVILLGVLKWFLSIFAYPVSDEFYYRYWSIYPDFSFMDHPPLIAWLMWLFALPFGYSIPAIKALCALVGTLNILIMLGIVMKIYDDPRTHRIFVLFTVIMPSFTGVAFVFTPDVFLGLTMALTLWFTILLDETGHNKYIYAIAVSFAAALLAKYSALVWCGLMFLPLLVRRPKLLRNPHTYLALVLILFIYSPVIYWNLKHDWISFIFQFKHATGEKRNTWEYFFEFISTQHLYLGIPLGLLFIGWAFKRLWKDREHLFVNSSGNYQTLILWCFAGSLLFFTYLSLDNKIEGNWTFFTWQLALIPCSELTRRLWIKSRKWKMTLAFNSLFLLFVMSVLIYESIFSSFSIIYHSGISKYYQEEIIPSVREWHKKYPDYIIAGNSYQTAAILSYWFEQPEIPSLNLSARTNHYDYVDRSILKGKDLLVLSREDPNTIYSAGSNLFDEIVLIDEYNYSNWIIKSQKTYLYRMQNYSGE